MIPALTTVDVAFACSLGSIAGSLFILLNWACNGAARRLFFLRLIVFLAVANLLSAIGYCMSFVEWRVLGRGAESPKIDAHFSQVWCLVQALLIVIFENVRALPPHPCTRPPALTNNRRSLEGVHLRANGSMVWSQLGIAL